MCIHTNNIQDAKLCVVAEDKCNPYNTSAVLSMTTVGLKVRVLALLVRKYFAGHSCGSTCYALS